MHLWEANVLLLVLRDLFGYQIVYTWVSHKSEDGSSEDAAKSARLGSAKPGVCETTAAHHCRRLTAHA